VVLAVVEDRAEIHQREARQETPGGGLADAPLYRGDEILGNGAAEDIVHKLDARAARQRLEFHAAHAELPVARRFASCACLRRQPWRGWFAVGHLGSFSVRST